ncbi:hypothetical protein [Anatilimnocola floriformis]|uniref:hypothetical protein n=1 Tax=Anatilimnocola floriformis TaxID=2948575 RepID=UPI0020C2AF52|nr:hypothetical protein [Anatilimnocola floriformis]
MQRIFCASLVVLVSLVANSFAQEFTPPPKAERDYLAALSKVGGRAQVDSDYRITEVNLGADCTNEQLKTIAACERLTTLSINSRLITDEGLAHLHKLNKLTTVTIIGSSATSEGVAALRASLPDATITSPRNATTRPAAQAGGGARDSVARSSGFNGAGGFGGMVSRATILLRNPAIQDDLKLTPEQRTQIGEATNSNAFNAVIKLIEDKAQALLTAEQRARLQQLELQQGGALAVIRAEIIPQLKITEDQVAAIQKLNDELGEESREIMRQALTQRGAEESSDELAKRLRDKIAEFNKKREEKILALLSDDQRKAWSALIGPKGPEVSASASFFSNGPGTAGGRERRGMEPTAFAKGLFTQLDADKDGMLTEVEFPATNRTRVGMTNAGITLVYPVNREVFVENYLKYMRSR